LSMQRVPQSIDIISVDGNGSWGVSIIPFPRFSASVAEGLPDQGSGRSYGLRILSDQRGWTAVTRHALSTTSVIRRGACEEHLNKRLGMCPVPHSTTRIYVSTCLHE
jgi:hypothetical protein